MMNAAVNCPGCGYDLRGHASVRCPECGREVDWGKVRKAPVAWVHRRELGRMRAYVRTVWAVATRSDALRGMGISRREGTRFAFWHGVAGFLLFLGFVWADGKWLQPDLFNRWLLVNPMNAEGWGWVVPWQAMMGRPLVWVALTPAAGVGSWMFLMLLRWSLWWGRDARLAKQRIWTGTALVAWVLPLAGAVGGVSFVRVMISWGRDSNFWFRERVFVACLFVAWLVVLGMMMWLIGRAWKFPGKGWGRAVLAAVVLPWVVLTGAVGSFLMVSWVVGWLMMVVWSLRA